METTKEFLKWISRPLLAGIEFVIAVAYFREGYKKLGDFMSWDECIKWKY